MAVAVYPGSFDPVTLGHIDIIERSSKMMDRIVVAVLNNSSKSPLFSVEERVKMLRDATEHLGNVEVAAFDGLTVDFVRKCHATVIIRGLRAVTDFEYELQMAQTNRVIDPQIDTMFLTTNLNYSYLSSSIVKEIARYGGDLHAFVSPQVAEAIRCKMQERSKES